MISEWMLTRSSLTEDEKNIIRLDIKLPVSSEVKMRFKSMPYSEKRKLRTRAWSKINAEQELLRRLRRKKSGRIFAR